MTLLHPELLLLSPLAALASLAVYLAERKAQGARVNWGSTEGRKRPWARPLMLGVAFLTLIAALARPVWDPQTVSEEASGQDTVFMVDVSRSMLTTDLSGGQSRLEGVKRAILDLLPTLKGDQVALVAFAGTTVVKCPLTGDLAYFGEAVRLLEPGSTSRGGTLLGDALRSVKTNFVKEGKGLAVWVFTDGGDQESFPVEAAKDLSESGCRLFVWGVGSQQGGPVPGQNVSSVLNEELLKGVAAAGAQSGPGGDGRYWGVETPLWQLGSIYGTHRERHSVRKSDQVVWQEGSWWLLWPALSLVLLSFPPRIPRRRRPGS